MNYHTLTNRLQAIYDLIPNCSLMADVGTDHGKLPLALVETGKCERVIATDISSNSLNKLKSMLPEYDTSNRIECIVSDGLANLGDTVPEVVVIAGMGGRLIIEILERSPEVTCDVDLFVFQPNTNEGEVREYLHCNGFEIVDERAVEESDQHYQIISAVHGRQNYKLKSHYKYGYLNLIRQDPAMHRYLLSEMERIEGIIGILEKLENSPGERLDRMIFERDIVEEALKHYETI